MLTCERDGCEVTFTPKAHNQKYCSSECCREATNKRIMEKYYERQARRKGKTRVCKSCNITKLSRYNESRVCGSCQTKHREEVNAGLQNLLSSVTWA